MNHNYYYYLFDNLVLKGLNMKTDVKKMVLEKFSLKLGEELKNLLIDLD
jgi:hypothetical protein